MAASGPGSGPISPNVATLASSNTKFAWQLYQAVSTGTKGNVLFSPFSITVAMGMTLLGTKSKTAEQVKKVMNYAELDDEKIHSAFSDIQDSLNKIGSEHVKMHVANRLYGHQGYNFLQAFLDNTVKHYNAEFGKVDFGQSEPVRQEINKWVEGQTAQKIKDLIGPNVLNSLTRLVLVNAIYFKGNWDNKFEEAATSVEDFHVTESKSIKVDMMHTSHKLPFGYSKDLNAMLLELPYVGKQTSLYVLLPAKMHGLQELESKLTADHLHKLQETFQPRPIKTDVSLPKFKLDGDFSLSETLSMMGMPDLFTEGVADLSGMDGTKELYVSAVLHKAFMEVNEEGTEAAAATAHVIMTRSLPMTEEFNANHPFLFFIQDKVSHNLLFMGRMNQPPASQSKDEL